MKRTSKISSFSKYRLILLSFITLVSLSLGACTSNETSTPTIEDIGAEYTSAAETVIAEITRLASSDTPTSSANLATDEPPIQETPPTETATQTITPTQEPTITETTTPNKGVPPLPNYNTILDDDFSSGTGWYTSGEEDYGFRFTDFGYLIYVNILKATIWSIRDITLKDVRVEITAEQIDGPQDGYYGVTCRHIDENNYYALVISNNGQYGIAKMEQGEFEFIREGMAPSSAINPEGNNHVTGDCIGENLILYANDIKLTEIQDGMFESGVFGMVTGTRLHDGVEVNFSRILVKAP